MSPPNLTELLEKRDRAHRLDGTSVPMANVLELVDWLGAVRVALVSGRSSVPNAAEAIVARPVEGSWWGDRDGSLIYRLLEELDALEPRFLDIVLVGARRTLVHPDLVPLVVSVAAEPGRRRRATDALPVRARDLLSRLEAPAGPSSERAGGSTGKADRSARTALEGALLARSVSTHTESGRHVSFVETFGTRPEAATASYQSALSRLVEASLRSAVVAQENEVGGWFRKIEPDEKRRMAAVESLTCRRLTTDGTVWLAAE